MGIFTELETKTLNVLYPNEKDWWEFLWVISDRVQEEVGEVAAEGIRFLTEICQRPFKAATGTHWWCASYLQFWVSSCRNDKRYQNYIPVELGLTVDRKFELVTEGLETFTFNWKGLLSDAREALWKQWVQDLVFREVTSGVR